MGNSTTSFFVKKCFTSTGVDCGISLKITIHRLRFGRTFSPFSSTCTLAHSGKVEKLQS